MNTLTFIICMGMGYCLYKIAAIVRESVAEVVNENYRTGPAPRKEHPMSANEIELVARVSLACRCHLDKIQYSLNILDEYLEICLLFTDTQNPHTILIIPYDDPRCLLAYTKIEMNKNELSALAILMKEIDDFIEKKKDE